MLRQRLSRSIRQQLASLFSLLAILSPVGLVLRSLLLVSCPNGHYHQDDNDAALSDMLHEWKGQQQQDAATATTTAASSHNKVKTNPAISLLLEQQSKELDALRREKREQQQHHHQYYELQIANLSATIQEQAIELETMKRSRRGDQQQYQQQQQHTPPVRQEDSSPPPLGEEQRQRTPLVFNVHHSSSHAIFYNIYIPPPDVDDTNNTEKMDNAFRIVKEQIHQVKASFAMLRQQQHADSSDSDKKKVVPLFYNTIGHAIVNATWMKQLCTTDNNDNDDNDNNNDSHRLSLDCIFLNHYNTSSTSTVVFEDVTLQRVLDYCQSSSSPSSSSQPTADAAHHHDGNENENKTVIYMHSKGSFNPRDGSNDVWRRHLTNAVTSQECILAITATQNQQNQNQQQCNVCGLLFNPMPGMHFPGNFFTARCSYVQHLLPPLTFQTSMNEHVVPRVMARRLRKTFEMNLYPMLDPWMHGVDRWAFEWWIASHPAVVPCDLSVQTSIYHFKENNKKTIATVTTTAAAATSSITDATNNDDPLTSFTWAMAPRFSYRDGNWDYTTGASRKFVMRKQERRRTEYALLAGHLFRWIAIYNDNNSNNNNSDGTLVVPPDDSWIWEWFPEGQFWRDQVRKYGREAVNVTTARFAVF